MNEKLTFASERTTSDPEHLLPWKVLIVDDDEDLVEMIKEAFVVDGRFEVRTANNGFGAGMCKFV